MNENLVTVLNYGFSPILLAVLVWVTQELYRPICVGFKTKTTYALNWGAGGRGNLNVFRLRRTRLSHTIKYP